MYVLLDEQEQEEKNHLEGQVEVEQHHDTSITVDGRHGYNGAVNQYRQRREVSKRGSGPAKDEVEHQITICKSAISLDNKSAVAKITNNFTEMFF